MDKFVAGAYVRKQVGTREKLEPAWSAMLFHEPEDYASMPNPLRHAGRPRQTGPFVFALQLCPLPHRSRWWQCPVQRRVPPPTSERTHLFDIRPLHHTFGIARPSLVARGSADNSVLYRRVGMRGAGQMPPLASSVVDQPAVQLLHDWIDSLAPLPTPGAAVEDKRLRILCLGDSITEGHTYPLVTAASLQAAGKPVPTFINAGIGGDTAAGMRARLARDVFPRRPSLVLLSAGGQRHPSQGPA